jgi:DNA-binding LacI/PurR family transcriptional regulator
VPRPAVSTIRDIARAAKVSTATVSLSLRNRPGVAEKTRAAVLAHAQALGYRPNPYVSALMRLRRNPKRNPRRPTLAVLHGLGSPKGWRFAESLVRRQIFDGIADRASELGYVISEFSVSEGRVTPMHLSRMLRARGIEGIVLGPLADGMSPPALRWDWFSVISVSVPYPHLPLHVVCNDHYFSSYTAVQECRQRGYRRPGLLMRRSHRTLFRGRWDAGYFAAQLAHAPDAFPAPLLLDVIEEIDAFDCSALRRWLRQERPDVIITSAAAVVNDVLKELGVAVPDEIGLVSLSCPELGDHISGVCQNGHLIGTTAIDQLTHRLERNERGLPAQPLSVMVQGLWNPGATLRDRVGRGRSASNAPRDRAIRPV